MRQYIFVTVILIGVTYVYGGTKPGTFFWKPRIGLDLVVQTTGKTPDARRIQMPNKQNVRAGVVVLIDGYQAGITLISLMAGLSSGFGPDPHLNPISAYYFTNVYRWALRYFSLIPYWAGTHESNFCETTKVWRRRFYYMNQFIPKWLKYIFPFVKNEEWEKEEMEFKRFKKYSESAFGKHFRYPSKVFNDYKSEETQETAEKRDASSSGVDK
ncbi:uncharacterized protein LOC114245197 [Bombyx mandarina]|uniref:Uncharacterized protein LOC114245197 n=1 Tax=Bombyx mandarina TaxID=7092 RepID=A0A6J2JTC1_BOMMA|nr:uncharacterized protein LOC114245197 [Bombyx mandarina]